MSVEPSRPPEGAIVHIVDDDPAIRDSLAFMLASRGMETRQWASGEAFLAGVEPFGCACVILDMRMAGLGGQDVFEQLRRRDIALPVLFLTGHGDVPAAVEALKKGAFDFVEKPFNDNSLADSVVAALHRSQAERGRRLGRDAVEQRLASLTSREREVLGLLLAGRLNKQIADELALAIRTVEVHRSRVLEKMGVRNAVELARLMADRRATE